MTDQEIEDIKAKYGVMEDDTVDEEDCETEGEYINE